MEHSLVHRKNKKKREMQNLYYQIKSKYQYHDYIQAETVWTETTSKAVYQALKVQFGNVPMHFLQLQNPAMSKNGLTTRKFSFLTQLLKPTRR